MQPVGEYPVVVDSQTGVNPEMQPLMAQQPMVEPGMVQPGMQQPMMQPGMVQPGMEQPMMQQPMMQPGMQQPMMQPGMQQPGMQQPMMQQPGMVQQQPMVVGVQQPMMVAQPGVAMVTVAAGAGATVETRSIEPTVMLCTYCGHQGPTKVDLITGNEQWLWCGILFFLGCFFLIPWFFCCVPFCCGGQCQGAVHHCGKCNQVIARKY